MNGELDVCLWCIGNEFTDSKEVLMFTRIRIAMVFALAVILITSITAFAKGGFSFIAITGENLEKEIRSTDPALTENFFAFADFYRHKTNALTDPGAGYEITRYYIEGVGEIAFDRLHYYPETGFVFYDGIVNGSSEYDGQWYTAKAEIKNAFESALSFESLSAIQSSASQTVQTQPKTSLSSYFVVLAALGLSVVLFFTYRLRKSISH
jgi:hypothetical protein